MKYNFCAISCLFYYFCINISTMNEMGCLKDNFDDSVVYTITNVNKI